MSKRSSAKQGNHFAAKRAAQARRVTELVAKRQAQNPAPADAVPAKVNPYLRMLKKIDQDNAANQH